jgi:predicted phosphodiesterase
MSTFFDRSNPYLFIAKVEATTHHKSVDVCFGHTHTQQFDRKLKIQLYF